MAAGCCQGAAAFLRNLPGTLLAPLPTQGFLLFLFKSCKSPKRAVPREVPFPPDTKLMLWVFLSG